jgi:hypothetical protein
MTNRRETKSIKASLLNTTDAVAISVERSSMSTSHKREIAFIDPGVDDLQTLLKGIRPDVEPILLTVDEPAPRQMARAVRGREGLEAIHVIAHGRPGEVSFSAGALSLDSMDQYKAELAEVGRGLRAGGLQLWTCETGLGEQGTDFVDGLARVTGAEVAASTKRIGAMALGGTWELRPHRSGASVGSAPLTEAGIKSYGGIMAVNIKSATIKSISGDTGTSSTDFVTDDPVQTISGTVNVTGNGASDTLDVFLVGGAFGSGNGTLVGTVSVSASGNWSLNLATSSVLAARHLADGTYIIRLADVSRPSTTLASQTLIIDTTPPTVSSIATSGKGITAGSGDLNAGDTVTLTVKLRRTTRSPQR